MFLTGSSISGLALELRELCGDACALVEQLETVGQWSGPDADQFKVEFNQHVRDKLLTAAALLDAVAVGH